MLDGMPLRRLTWVKTVRRQTMFADVIGISL